MEAKLFNTMISSRHDYEQLGISCDHEFFGAISASVYVEKK